MHVWKALFRTRAFMSVPAPTRINLTRRGSLYLVINVTVFNPSAHGLVFITNEQLSVNVDSANGFPVLRLRLSNGAYVLNNIVPPDDTMLRVNKWYVFALVWDETWVKAYSGRNAASVEVWQRATFAAAGPMRPETVWNLGQSVFRIHEFRVYAEAHSDAISRFTHQELATKWGVSP